MGRSSAAPLLETGHGKCGRLARKFLEERDEQVDAIGNTMRDGDGNLCFGGAGATGEQGGEAGSGFARCGAAGVSREDGVSGDGGADGAGVSEMDSGRACAKRANRGCNRSEISRERKRNCLAAEHGGYVRV